MLQEVLGVSSRAAIAMVNSFRDDNPSLSSFEYGWLPCSFLRQLLWEPILAQLDQFNETLADESATVFSPRKTGLEHQRKLRWDETELYRKWNEVINVQPKRKEASRKVQSTKRMIRNAFQRVKLAQKEKAGICNGLTFEEALYTLREMEELRKEGILAKKEEELLKQYQNMFMVELRPFLLAAARAERQVVSELEDQLQRNRDILLEKGELSLLMNCFGADEFTIKVLKHLNSLQLRILSVEDVQLLISHRPLAQQKVVLRIKKWLEEGAPFIDHQGALEPLHKN